MRILHINSYDFGGAANAALRLHQGLLNAGHDSRFMTLGNLNPNIRKHATIPAPKVKRWQWWMKRMGILTNERFRFEERLSKESADIEAFAGFRTDTKNLINHPEVQQADVINLHWISHLIDWPTFFTQVGKPVVWTLHDMYPFTGGCHYDQECKRFTVNCGKCPILKSENKNDSSRYVWQGKNKALRPIEASQLTIVSPSKWLQKCSQQSSLFSRFESLHIPYGIDLDTFKPRSKNKLRQELGIDEDSIMLLFVADYATPRKGLHLLKEALALLINDNLPLTLVSVGANNQFESDAFQHINLGKVDDQKQLAEIYSATDLFICPSIQDNLPNTVLEAMASGTPTIAFNTGGLPDMVFPGKTGFLAERLNSKSLAQAIRTAAKDPSLKTTLRESTRQYATENYPLIRQAKKYNKLYTSILK